MTTTERRLEELTQELNLHAKNLPVYLGSNDRRIDSTQKRISYLLKEIGKLDPKLRRELSPAAPVAA